MKNFPTKANLSGGDDSGTATKFGAKEFNSIADELELAVTATGQTLTTGTSDDPSPDQLAKALTITAQTAHSYQDSGSANAYVLTRSGSLEQPNSYIDGMHVTFVTANANTGASTVNVSSIGSKKILMPDGSEIQSGSIASGGTVDLIYDSAADSGTGAFIYRIGASLPFLQSLSANGYQKFPSGLIMQWGTSGAMSGSPNATVVVTYPIAFPSLVGSVAVTSTGLGVFCSVASIASLTNFTITNSTSSTSPAYWVAIGY